MSATKGELYAGSSRADSVHDGRHVACLNAGGRARTTDLLWRVEALPFPPDAREVVLDATFDGIRFTSGSSLGALLDFYRKGMVKRGWTEDKSAFESDEGDAEMTFQHDGAEAVIEFYVASDGVRVSIDCEGLDFSLANDPAALIAAGVPQPRSYLFLRKAPSSGRNTRRGVLTRLMPVRL